MAGRGVLQLLCLTSTLISPTRQGGGRRSPAGLAVNPDSSQFLKGDGAVLRCGDGGTVFRDTRETHRRPCGDGWGEPSGSSCYVTAWFSWFSGVYWCESGDGARSASVNITVTDSVVLQSPLHPVTEGQNVTLECRTRTPSDRLKVAFYKDGASIGTRPGTRTGKWTAGHMTLRHVSLSDGGVYRCRMGGGESPPSRVSVTEAPPPEEAPPTESDPTQLVIGAVRHLLVFCPFFISTLLMVSTYRRRAKGNRLRVSRASQGLEDAAGETDAAVAVEHGF